jgi:hypothetical protein
MSFLDAVERFDAVVELLSAAQNDDDDATVIMCMVPEVQALIALFSLEPPEDWTLMKVAEIGHARLIKTSMLSLEPAQQQQVVWLVARQSLVYGHLAISQWLHTAFQLTSDDVRANTNCALRLTCSEDHLDVVKYLHAEFQLTSDDARTNDNLVLREVCRRGHLGILQYLRTGFQLTSDDARACNNLALYWACEFNHIDILKYLHSDFQLTKKDARSNFALKAARRHRHVYVIKYLCSEF